MQRNVLAFIQAKATSLWDLFWTMATGTHPSNQGPPSAQRTSLPPQLARFVSADTVKSAMAYFSASSSAASAPQQLNVPSQPNSGPSTPGRSTPPPPFPVSPAAIPRGFPFQSRSFRSGMAEQPQPHEEGGASPKHESLMEKLADKLHVGGGKGDSSSSDSDNDERPRPSAPPAPPADEVKQPSFSDSAATAAAEAKVKVFRLFGREQPIHKALGGGKPADVFLWRNRNISAGVLGGATSIWILFELLGYHLLTFVCHGLIFSLGVLFLWSNASSFIHKAPPKIPEVIIPEDLVVNIALSTRYEINRAFANLRQIALGRDIKKFLMVIAGFWLLSVLGSCCNFLSLVYIVFVVLHTVPVLYEKYEDQIDSYGEKGWIEIKKQYAVFDEKVLSKVPRGPAKDKKH